MDNHDILAELSSFGYSTFIAGFRSENEVCFRVAYPNGIGTNFTFYKLLKKERALLLLKYLNMNKDELLYHINDDLAVHVFCKKLNVIQ